MHKSFFFLIYIVLINHLYLLFFAGCVSPVVDLLMAV